MAEVHVPTRENPREKSIDASPIFHPSCPHLPHPQTSPHAEMVKSVTKLAEFNALIEKNPKVIVDW